MLLDQTLGIIGSGNIGTAVARLATAAGLDVILSNSRGPETLASLAARLGPHARTGIPVEAAEMSDWTLFAVPFSAGPHLPAETLAGKIVIDANNYYPARDGIVPELEAGNLTARELFQRHVPDGRIVKRFSTIYSEHLVSLARPAGSTDRSALPVSGDDADAKTAIVTLLDKLGYDAIDAGTVAEDWRVQSGSPAYLLSYLSDRRLAWTDDPGVPAPAAALRAGLNAARRT